MSSKLTERQVSSIIRLMETTSATEEEIARRFGVSACTVRRISKEAGLPLRRNRWTEEEDEFLRRNYPSHGALPLVDFLPRHPNRAAIAIRAYRLGLKAEDPNRYGRHSRRLQLKAIDGGLHEDEAEADRD